MTDIVFRFLTGSPSHDLYVVKSHIADMVICKVRYHALAVSRCQRIHLTLKSLFYGGVNPSTNTEKSTMAITKTETYKLMFKNYPDVVSVAQLSEMLSISDKTIYRMVKDNRIGFFKIGRTYKFAKVHIFDYLGIV